jgi:hypothetical protein
VKPERQSLLTKKFAPIDIGGYFGFEVSFSSPPATRSLFPSWRKHRP